MRPRYLILMFSALLVLKVQAGEQAGERLPAFKAHYIVKIGPIELGRSLRELQYGADGELVFRSDSDTTGVAALLFPEHIRQISRLKQDGARVLPLEYSYQRDGKRDSTMTQQFDWKQGLVTSHVNEAVYIYPLDQDAIDQSAFQISLMVDLEKGEREFRYHVAGKSEMRTLEVSHVGDERIDTVFGELNTVVIQRKDEQITTMWCAYNLHFLPVKIQHEEKGGVFTAYLESVEGLTIP